MFKTFMCFTQTCIKCCILLLSLCKPFKNLSLKCNVLPSCNSFCTRFTFRCTLFERWMRLKRKVLWKCVHRLHVIIWCNYFKVLYTGRTKLLPLWRNGHGCALVIFCEVVFEYETRLCNRLLNLPLPACSALTLTAFETFVLFTANLFGLFHYHCYYYYYYRWVFFVCVSNKERYFLQRLLPSPMQNRTKRTLRCLP